MITITKMENIHFRPVCKESGRALTEKQWAEMETAMIQHKGIGIAANQIGIRSRGFIAVINGVNRRFIDPTVTPLLEFGQIENVEGCLSVPGKAFKVTRWAAVEVKFAGSADARKRVERFFGLEAIIIQHEMDHLRGKTIKHRGVRI